jgi:Kef-type K+ transport system membrane component KefB
MNTIEILVVIMLVLMAIPDLCAKPGRPSLTYIAYILVGFLLGPVLNPSATSMLKAVGEFGFVLLLFEIGLEIELKLRPAEAVFKTLRFAATWCLLQYPVLILLGKVAGLSWHEALLAACALTACSMSLALPALRHYPNITADVRAHVMAAMVWIEVQAIVVLAAGGALLQYGISYKLLLQLMGISLAILFIGFSANHLATRLKNLLEKTTHWRIHIIVLFILIVAAVGERMGLSAPKTAFFLGLFINRTTHQGLSLDRHLAPISQRLLIPVFLVSLGILVPMRMLVSWSMFLALCSTVFLLAFRDIMHKRYAPTGGDRRTFLLLCPNMTIVAVGVQALQNHGSASPAIAWFTFMGLFLSVISILGLPRVAKDGIESPI